MDDQLKLIQKLNRRTRFTLFLVWIALFFTAAGIAAGYKNWLRIHDKAKAGLAGIAEIREELSGFARQEQVLPLQEEIKKQLTNGTEEVKKTLIELREIQQSTKHSADSVYEQIKQITQRHESSPNIQQPSVTQDWYVAEVRFLLQTAIQVLQLKHDKLAALKALNMADKRLIIIGSSQFLLLRKQISKDIASLYQYETPNLTHLSAKITILQKQLDADRPADRNIVSAKKTAPETNNNSLINKVKRTINKAVVVRRLGLPLHSEIDAETQKSLSQLLSLKFETLRIMLLQKQNENYHEQLESINKIFQQYYPEKKFNQYKNILTELDSVNLTPAVPDISTSLKLLDSISSSANSRLDKENK